jgi:hypothetical protein
MMLTPSVMGPPETEAELPFWGTEGNDAGKKDVLGTTNERDLKIITNDEQRMVVTSEGKVGIGIAEPQYMLDVNGDVHISGQLYVNSGTGPSLEVTPTGVGIGTTSPTEALDVVGNVHVSEKVLASAYASNSPLIFEAPAGTERARIDDVTGNFGIGTTNPQGILQVQSNPSIGTGTISSSGTIVYGTGTIFLTELSVGSEITAAGETKRVTGVWTPGQLRVDSAWSSDLSGASFTYTYPILFVAGNGYIGMGTGSPRAKLDVKPSGPYGSVGGAATIGHSTVRATGDYAIAVGYDTFASGLVSFATGYHTEASATYSTAMGEDTTASGKSSTAMGFGTTARGMFSTAMGHSSQAYGHSSTAIGGGSAGGDESIAMGRETSASGICSIAMGKQTNANGYASTAMGNRISAVGNFSFGIGLGGWHSYKWRITQPNTMAIMNGNVGIGTVSPSEKLDVEGNVHASGSFIAGSTTDYGDGCIGLSAGTDLDIDSGTLFIDNANDRVGIGTSFPDAKLDVGLSWIPGGSPPGGAATIGHHANSATGDFAIAMGFFTKASGRASTAMGWSTIASGYFSTTMGYFTKASGWYSTAMGIGTEASGNQSIAMGVTSIASGNRSIALGYRTKAGGYASTAMGYETEAIGDFSTAIGTSIKANATYSIGIGLAPHISPPEIKQPYTMAIMGGKVGIGTVTPNYKLSIGDGTNERIHFSGSTSPLNPPSGSVVIYFDGTDLKVKNSSGLVRTIADF